MSLLQYRRDIDGLRAIAVLSVLIFHVCPSYLPGGFLGVDIFFVISGYLISLIIFQEQSNDSFSYKKFYARRIRRLFPALTIVLFATILFGAFALFPDEYKRVGSHAVSAIVFLLNFRLMHETGYFDIASDTKPFLHLWSLSVEEQFYLAWPVLLLLSRRLRLQTGTLISLCIVGSIGFTLYLINRNLDELFFHPLARFWELLLGAGIAYWHHQRGIDALPAIFDNFWMRQLLSISALSTLIATMFLIDGKTPHPGLSTVLPLAAVTVLIASGSGATGNRLLTFTPLVSIGLISYPIYLWHWPLLSYLRIIEAGTPAQYLLWTAAVISIVLAGLTYKFVEQPLRNLRNTRHKLVGLMIVMGTLLAISQFVVATDGAPNRPALRYVKEAETQMVREPRQDHSCLNLFPEGQVPVYCRIQENDGPMIAIIGDSHAHVLFPGIAKLAGQKGYGTLLLANSSCPPFKGAVTGRNQMEKERCAESIETILQTVEKNPRINMVVIASRGPIYLTGKGFGPAESHVSMTPISAMEKRSIAATVSPMQTFADGLGKSVRRLQAKGKTVAYFLQIPELGVPARNCLGRPLSIMQENKCEVGYEDYSARTQQYRALINQVRTTNPTLGIIDPEPIFCSAKACSGMRNNTLLYADDDHLSVNGSDLVAPLILKTLNLEPKVR
jgi:peptidoglycan/LPS O-acetylase OafA/YrhL